MVSKAYSIEDGNLQSRSVVSTKKRVYKDLDLTFARAANNDVFKKTDAAAVKQAVKNILLTNRLEKPFNATFGGNLNRFLFELSEYFDEQEIEDETLSGLEKFLNQSYNIKSESEERMSRLGFASVSTPELDDTMKTLRASQEDLIDDSRRKLEMSQLDLERKRQSEIFGIEDIIRNLQLERRQYS